MLSAILSSTLWSGKLFEQFSLTQVQPTVNSLADLMAYRERKTFCIPPDLSVEIEEFKLKFGVTIASHEFDIISRIFSGNVSFYYMLTESRAKQIFSVNDAVGQQFHIIPDLYLCEYLKEILKLLKIHANTQILLNYRWFLSRIDVVFIKLFGRFNANMGTSSSTWLVDTF